MAQDLKGGAARGNQEPPGGCAWAPLPEPVNGHSQHPRPPAALPVGDDQLRLILESTGEGIYALDVHGNCTWCNPAALRLLGYETAQSLLGKSMHLLLHQPESRGQANPPEACRLCQACVRGEGSQVDDEVFRRADGSSFPVAYRSYPARRGGATLGAVVTFSDISDRQKAERALRASEARKAAILETALDGIITIDHEGKVVEFNPAAQRLFGYGPAEALGQPVASLIIPPAQRAQHFRGLARYLADGVGPILNQRLEVMALRSDGTECPVELAVTAIPTAGPPLFTAYIRDLTDRKQAEERVARAEQQLRQAQKMEAVGQLAGGVAHDFNNLLTIILGYGDFLLDKLAAGDPCRDLVKEMKKAGERAAGLTRRLLAFSRQQVLAPKNFYLDEQVREAEQMLRRVIDEDIDIALVLEAKAGPVRADPCQIDQVLLNLAVNARDAMPKGGKLTLEVARIELDERYTQARPEVTPGPYVLLAVSDTGHGMTPEIKDRIFEPFFTTKEPGKGTGLGLATVYGIVKQSGGHIAVYSEPGQGTTFKIYLPCTPAAPTLTDKSSPGVSRRPGGHETVLLVEDEDALRVLGRHVLQACGYTVLEARHGVEALRILAQHPKPIHLLVSDVVMPQMGGRELADCLAALRPDIKVLFCSGYTDETVVRHGILEAGAEFLQKPFTPSALARKVREVIER